MATLKVIRKLYEALERANSKYIVVYGGAGAGKSFNIAAFLLFERLLCYPSLNLLATRKVGRTIRFSLWELFVDLLSATEVPFSKNSTEKRIELPNGSYIQMLGVDEPEKLKSSQYNFIWMEEATEFDLNDFEMLRLRLRRKTPDGMRNQMILSFNPVSKNNWVYAKFFQQDYPDTTVIHATHRDNPFLDREYVELLKNLERENYHLFEIYAEGKFSDFDTNLIYPHYKIVDELPKEFEAIACGVDFGFNNPCAVVKVGLKDGVLYVIDEIYRRGLTQADLVKSLKHPNWVKHTFVCDSAEPDRIEDMRRAGLKAVACEKEDLLYQIQLIQSHPLYIHRRCSNTLKEIQQYSWKIDKKTNQILDEPTKFMDHAMDALRYAAIYLLGKTKPEFVVKEVKIGQKINW